MMDVSVYRIATSGPEDLRGLKELVDKGEINPEEIIAVLGKTEGNGNVNDFTRGYSTFVFRKYLAEVLGKSEEEIGKKIAFVMSGGTEGVMTPHVNIFTVKADAEGEESDKKSLAVSAGFTRDFLPEEFGTMAMVKEVKRVVLELIDKAGISAIEDVHFVQIKCPLLTSDRINDAQSRGKKVATEDTYLSMGYPRGASALGIGVALGEIEESSLSDEVILNDWSIYSNIASTSAGVELMNCEIIVMGNSTNSVSKFRIGHSVMKDAIDLEAVLEALRNSGLEFDSLPGPEDKKRIVNVFAKAEASPDGYVKKRRTTMLTDSDIHHTRYARAVVNAVIASVVDDPMVYVSGGSEHQGPAGGGPIAVIIRQKE
ncbi:MAG TPA: ring-opening amidohydrolase [Clostridiaceae bacterium]|nr:ring-opening amidohydrolase [Clostridiaceae bacterium]